MTPPPPSSGRQSSFASDAGVARDRLRPTSRIRTADLFGDPSPSDDSAAYSGTDRSPRAGSVSPATSAGSGVVERKGSWANLRGGGGQGQGQGLVVKKGPPPPPPSRGRKIAPPPPPPMKRAF